MANTISMKDMLNYYAQHAMFTTEKAGAQPPKAQFGYLMGGDGRVATASYIESLMKQIYPKSFKSYIERAAHWINRPTFDCNSVVEYYYKLITKDRIDVQAKDNYASWCSKKSGTVMNERLTGLIQLPGVALFSGSIKANDITHVGFLLYKYGSGYLDWYVLESRGVDYGLVVRRLKDATEKPWRWWGLMDRYFNYDAKEAWRPDCLQVDYIPTQKITGDSGLAEVYWLQDRLNRVLNSKLTVDCSYGANTAKAVIEFRKLIKDYKNTYTGKEVPLQTLKALASYGQNG